MSYQVQYDFEDSLFFLFIKKHYCPKCSTKLKVKFDVRKITLNNQTSISKEFKVGKYEFIGDKLIKRPYFYCDNCSLIYKTKQIRSIEKRKS